MNNINYLKGAISASGCVGQAWELFTRNPGLYLGAGLVTILMISCVPIVNFLLLGPIMGGYAYLVLADLRGERIEFGMLFKGFEKFVPLMLLGLVQAIPGIIFQIAQYTVDISRLMGGAAAGDANFYQASGGPGMPGVQTGIMVGMILFFLGYMLLQMLWNAMLTFAIPLVVEHDASFGDAIKMSLAAVFSNLGGLILLVILNFFVALLGMLALCIGIFVAIPVTFATYVIAYRQVFPAGGPAFQTGPPTPDIYGGSFGRGV